MAQTSNIDGGSPTPTPRWAVIIGIDHYGDRDDLQGCANDALLVSGYVQDCLNIPPSQIFLHIAPKDDWERWGGDVDLLEATPAAVKRSLYQIMKVSEGNNGAFVHVHFSGHGDTQPTIFRKGVRFDEHRRRLHWFSDLELTETSSLVKGEHNLRVTEKSKKAVDELLCFPDDETITDVEFGKMLSIMTDKGLTVSVTIDCCFSGGATRAGGNVRCRSKGSLEAKERGIQLGEDMTAAWQSRNSTSFDSLLFHQQQHYNAMMACQSWQQAGEGIIEEYHPSRYYGFFTSTLISRLRGLGNYREYITYGQIQGIIGVIIEGKTHARQIPAYFGPDNRLLFESQTSHDPREFSYVKEDENDTLVIAKGTVAGAQIGDKFRLLEVILPETKANEGGRGTGIVVELADVSHFQSTFKVLGKESAPKDINDLLKAKRVAQLIQRAPISVQLTDDNSEEARNIVKKLQAEPLTPFTLVPAEESGTVTTPTMTRGRERYCLMKDLHTRWWDVWTYIILICQGTCMCILGLFGANFSIIRALTAPQVEAQRSIQPPTKLRLHVNGRGLEICDGEGKPFSRLPKISTTDDKTAEWLTLGLETMHNFQLLSSMKTPLAFNPDTPFEVKFLPIDFSRVHEIRPEDGLLAVEHQFNFTNKAKRPLYVTILNLNPFYGIEKIYPDGNERVKYVREGETIDDQSILTFVPPELIEQYKKDGFIHDVYKVIVTTQPVDLGHFMQPDLRSFEQAEHDKHRTDGQRPSRTVSREMPTTGWWVYDYRIATSNNITKSSQRPKVKKTAVWKHIRKSDA